ncbi:Lactosylceramide 1,3-N-acetyl-beta-D-glucosaminyltransferase B [Tetrabaena socialis]|uniref:Hexosyltransferase n=1 Tax=Tetrabaena socialis TaxID=47790 RepID=A0A2J7ZY52_9CHLO|nr:Lactosylceramide 1,3-N-acetyl-beta-D-glucosaminyltransferase B [Tetrabaena socialis]|eukprot:PNH05204.1 Lactosylceramide 1,3-N-acetyl-beta-D-glucosaminyltransferase B [Tetrabaena socialis]
MELDEGTPSSSSACPPRLCIFVSTAAGNVARRSACRKSWFRYLTSEDSPLDARYRGDVRLVFVVSIESQSTELADEQAVHNDLVFVDAPEGYGHLWRKALAFMAWLEARSCGGDYDYVMHADDDSFVRLDVLVPLMAHWPRRRLYWGYVWDGTGNRVTAPIRNPANKSYMPEEQYPLDYYPPFASGCGFVLSRDLAQALLAHPLPDYRLLDPPFGIHLCGNDMCVLPDGPVAPVHDERVRPYRPIPIFRPDTLVQHYLTPEEMRPFYQQALASAAAGAPQPAPSEQGTPAQLYDTLVALGLLRR